MYISRRDGRQPAENAVRNWLINSGQLERVWHATDTEKEMWGLPDGLWVRFKYWQDFDDAYRVCNTPLLRCLAL